MIKYEVHVDDNGNKRWYLNGKQHREDGPAIECADGTKVWYLNGEELTEAQWREQTKPKSPCEGRVVEVEGVRYRLVAE